MYNLKLIKGRSYQGFGVKATNLKPLVAIKEEDKAEALVASGYFSLLSEADGARPLETLDTSSLDKMSTAQLIEFAKENDIDISNCKNNPERLIAIKATLSEKENEADFSEDT